MTNNSSERLDRLEAILETTIQGLAETRTALAETRQIVESNSRTLQGMLEQRATDRLEHQERMRSLESILNRVTNVQEGMARMVTSVDENQPTILRKLNAIESKVDQLLERD